MQLLSAVARTLLLLSVAVRSSVCAGPKNVFMISRNGREFPFSVFSNSVFSGENYTDECSDEDGFLENSGEFNPYGPLVPCEFLDERFVLYFNFAFYLKLPF